MPDKLLLPFLLFSETQEAEASCGHPDPSEEHNDLIDIRHMLLNPCRVGLNRDSRHKASEIRAPAKG